AAAHWAPALAAAAWVREPGTRRMATGRARPSAPGESAQPMRAMEPAVTPAIIPTAPSMLIHAKLTHERRRAARAPRIQSASRRGSVVEAGAQQASWQALDSVAEVPAGASETGCSGDRDQWIVRLGAGSIGRNL